MRKSGRLASIHEDNDSSSSGKPNTTSDTPSTTTSANSKKFTPTIPTVRRKKVVEEDQPVETVKPAPTSGSRSHTSNTRKPLHTPAPANVSGPLSLGPASMPRSSSRSSSSGGSGGILSARSLTRLNTSANSSNSSKPLSDSVPIEEEFSIEHAQNQIVEDSLLKPVVLLDSKNESSSSDGFTNFEPESGKLFLFQMPPVLPTLIGHQAAAAEVQDVEAEKWPSTAQGRYGKLRRYKSGRLTMTLENGLEFTLNSSIESAVEAQNTCVLAIDPEFGQSFNLGQVQAKLVAVPEFAVDNIKTE